MTKQTLSVWERAQARTEKNLAEKLARAICERAGIEGRSGKVGEKSHDVKYNAFGKLVSVRRYDKVIYGSVGGWGSNYGGSVDTEDPGYKSVPISCKMELRIPGQEHKFKPSEMAIDFNITKRPIKISNTTFVQDRIPISGRLYVARYASNDLPGRKIAITDLDSREEIIELAQRNTPEAKQRIAELLQTQEESLDQDRYEVQLKLRALPQDEEILRRVMKERKGGIERFFQLESPKTREYVLETMSNLGRKLEVPDFFITLENDDLAKKLGLPNSRDLAPVNDQQWCLIQSYKMQTNRIKIPLLGTPITSQVSQGLDYLADTLGKIRRAVEAGR